MQTTQRRENIAPELNRTSKLAISGIVVAAYVVIMYLTQGFAFGQYQIRIATGLYALAAVHPFLVVPLGLANLLSNTLMGGLGMLDMAGGLAAGLLTAGLCRLFGRYNIYLSAIPIMVVPTLLVPVWLSYILGLPYLMLVASLSVGQAVSGIAGAVLASRLKGRI
jgi:uncharacterized membrane protein